MNFTELVHLYRIREDLTQVCKKHVQSLNVSIVLYSIIIESYHILSSDKLYLLNAQSLIHKL